MKIKKIFTIYIILLHLFVIVILLKSNFIDLIQSKFAIHNNPPEISHYFKRVLAYHKRMDESIPDKSVILIGDSITEALAVAAVSPISVNYGIGGDTTVGVLDRLPYYKSLKRAKGIVVAIGFNDLKLRNNSQIIKNYKKILHKLPKRVPIVISAILPIDEEKIKNNALNNMRIIKLNKTFKSLCALQENVKFINPTNLLIDSSLNLADKFHIGDGIHLSKDGYSLWIYELKKAINTD